MKPVIRKDKSNNIGAISALKGYRVQFLYSLLRILSYTEKEAEFRPEGEFEDLDIYNEKGVVSEIIQVKDFGNTLTLSKILSAKENTFIRRALKAYKENNTPIIKLVSFGEINEDVKNLCHKPYPKKLSNKLLKLRLKQYEIDILQENFTSEIVNEQKIKEEIITILEKWSLYSNSNMTIDLLLYWIYYAAEKQRTITPANFKEQFNKIDKFQSERISFNKTYSTLIRPFDKEIETEDVEKLESDFYQGISASYKHILADVDVKRSEKLKTISEKFKESNIVFIHGASGQGKSTLAYRYLHEHCNSNTVFELKHLPEDITIIYDVINTLEGISKGINFPITLYIDVDPGNKEWINVLTDLASKQNFDFLVTIREEDWNSIEVGDKFQFSEIELLLEKLEAESIYTSLNRYNKDLVFIDFENAWDVFGGNGPLLEFVYLITQNESLSAKLKSQITKIREDSSLIGKDKIKLLRYIVLVDCFGSKIKYKELAIFLELHDIALLIDKLQKEYLIKISGSKSHITGLHPVRSEIIKNLLFDGEIFIESEYAIDSINFICDNTILSFLRNAFRRTNLSPYLLLEKLNSFTPKSWQSYLLIYKSLLWKGINDYVDNNIKVLDQIYSEYNKVWITVVNFDFANVIEGGSMMENSDLFSEEQRSYAKSVNKEFTDKKEIFKYCLEWLKSVDTITCIPNNKYEWDAFGLFLFWLHHFEQANVHINFKNFVFEKSLEKQPIETISHVLYALKTYSKQSQTYTNKIEKIFLKKLSITYNIISIDHKGSSVECHYLFDIIDENLEFDENDFMNAKSMKIIDSLRFAFPNKESYNTKGVGHKFSFLPDDIDSSIKQIPKKNLPLKPLVEINSTFLNLFNYIKRPSTWQEYVDSVVRKRLFYLKVLTNLLNAYKQSHKNKNYEALRLYVLDYLELRTELNESKNLLFPKNITDQWGDFGESGVNQKANLTPAISIERYKDFEKIYNEYSSSIETFLWQSANTIISKLKYLQGEVEFDNHTARVSIVGNLFKVFECIPDFHNSFRNHFEKFVESSILTKLERDEIQNISSICFLYRHFIYSNNYLTGNVSRIAINRIKETDLSFKKTVTVGFKQLAKQLECQINVHFDEKQKRCVIIANNNNTTESFEILAKIYNKLYEVISQPDYTSIKYLIVNSKYPDFCLITLVNGKSINGKWNEFKTYNLIEKQFDELALYNLIPQDIPSDILVGFNIESWNKILNEFKDLDKLLESISTTYQLANHFSQLKHFENKSIEDYNKKIITNHTIKIGDLIQDNFQQAIDLFSYYAELCIEGNVEFIDDDERGEILNFFTTNYEMFYPNDKLFEEKNLNFTISTDLLIEWTPRLEELTNNISIIYYYLAGKIIEGKFKDVTNIV